MKTKKIIKENENKQVFTRTVSKKKSRIEDSFTYQNETIGKGMFNSLDYKEFFDYDAEKEVLIGFPLDTSEKDEESPDHLVQKKPSGSLIPK